MSTTLVLSSARSRLSSSSSSTSTTSSAITVVRQTIAAATCSKHKTSAAAHNALFYYNLPDHHQKTTSSFFTTTTVSPTTYDGCRSLNNKQHQSHHYDVVMKEDLIGHKKQQQQITVTQQQQEQSQTDGHRLSPPLPTSSKNIDNIDTGIESSDSDINNKNKNNNNNNDNNNNNNHNNPIEKHFSRPPPSCLLRFCQFNQPLSSSCSSSKLLSKFSHHHQYQHQHRSSSSCFLSLPSSMMMPALCSPSRFCSSSSSSSSQPSSESSSNDNGNRNENNNENDDENDKINVTLFADSAKKILQDQKIAPLLFDENRTLQLVVGTIALNDLLSQFGVDTLLGRSIKSMSAIRFCDDEFDGSTQALYAKEYTKFLKGVKDHPEFKSFANARDLAAKLNGLQIITVYDWYMSVLAHRLFDDKQRALIRESCAASYQKAKEVDANRAILDAPAKEEQIRNSIQKLKEFINYHFLVPGRSYRHTWPFGFGLLARKTALTQLTDAVKQFKKDAKKEDLPLLIIRSMPRQGKTRLGDELGHRKDFYEWLNSETANAKNTFIFNLSFNANWKVAVDGSAIPKSAIKSMKARAESTLKKANEKIKDGDKKYKIRFDLAELEKLVCAERELCRRVVAAAVGIFRFSEYKMEARLSCEAFIEAHDYNLGNIIDEVCNLVAAARKRNLSESNFVFVLDEVTQLESQFLDNDEVLKVILYSSITSLIGPNSAVVVSGFSEAKEAISASDRKLKTIPLSPVSTVDQRRELHTMKTKFFQLCALSSAHSRSSTTPKGAIFYYELMKSAPGLLGTVIHDLLQRKESLGNIISAIPMIGDIGKHKEGPPLRDSMLEVMQLKSTLFCAGVNHDRPTAQKTSANCRSVVSCALKRAVQRKVVDASAGSDTTAIRDLCCARLEPLFVDAMNQFGMENLALSEYWEKLEFFSEIVSRATYKDGAYGAKASQITNKEDQMKILARFTTDDRIINQTTLPKIKNHPSNRSFEFNLPRLNGSFFEDAIAQGILFQRQLRRQLMNRPFTVPRFSSSRSFRKIEKTPRTSLKQYLDGCHVVFSTASDEKHPALPDINLVWWTASSSPSSSPKLVEFDNHFPNCSTDEEKNAFFPAKQKKASLLAANFNCDEILVPRRVDEEFKIENNPLADIFFHEKIVKSGRELENAEEECSEDELVQFWIDAKHRNDRYFPVSTKRKKEEFPHFVDRLRSALRNDSRITDPTSKVRHIVHIIVMPFNNDPEFNRRSDDFRSELLRANISPPSKLESYTLCFVSPDDLSEKKAFENLVSQPIALTVPLIEQQLRDSWTHQLDAPSQWWNYNATDGCHSRVGDRLEKRKGFTLSHEREENLLHKWCPVASRMTTPGAFTQWREIRFNGDCAVGIGHLFATQSDAFQQLSFEGTPGKYADEKPNSNVKENPLLALEIPFGCILEALGILPPRAHGTFYCQYDTEDFRFKLCLVETDTNNNTNNNNNNNNNNNVRFEISIIGEKSSSTKWLLTVKRVWLLEQIRVGHILRFCGNDDSGSTTPKSRNIRDYEEDQAITDLWTQKLNEYQDKFSVNDHSDQQHRRLMTCSDLWNMSLQEFRAVMVKGGSRAEFNQLVDELLPSADTKNYSMKKQEKTLAKLKNLVGDKIRKSNFDLPSRIIRGKSKPKKRTKTSRKRRKA